MGTTRARIAIDAMGGDHAPAEIVTGALRAREELGVEVLLVGDRAEIEAALPAKIQGIWKSYPPRVRLKCMRSL